MATSQQFIEFVTEQIGGEYSARYKKMFGEYMVYVNDKPVLLVCDDTVYVKKLPEIDGLMKDSPCGIPYAGSKEHYILDPENVELFESAIAILEKITPLPVKRNKTKKTS